MKHLGFLLLATFCLGADDESHCQLTSEECKEQIEMKRGEGDPIQCNDVEKYRACIAEVCTVEEIGRRVGEIMNREKLQCPDHVCWTEMKRCETTFNATLVELKLREHTEIKCRLAKGLVRCIEEKGNCTLQTTKETLHHALVETDCSEYIDLCNLTMEENCSMAYALTKKNRCEKLKDLKVCLRTQGSCPQGHIHLTMRRIMQDESFDCSAIDACNQIKEERCKTEALQNLVDTKENQCRRIKVFKRCMVAAQCNDLYLDFNVAKVDKILSNPCDGSSALLASIGLTLLLTFFSNLWK